jgi:hypothetical protein
MSRENVELHRRFIEVARPGSVSARDAKRYQSAHQSR